jgi:hypothetical protein
VGVPPPIARRAYETAGRLHEKRIDIRGLMWTEPGMTTESSSSPEQRAMTEIHRYFGHLADHRQSGKVDYPLISIIAIVLLGTL